MTPRRARLARYVALGGVAFAFFCVVMRFFRPREVSAARATKGPAAEVVYATGTIDLENRIQLRARSGGTVTKVVVREGEVVQAGQVLAVMENPRLTAQLRRTKSQLKVARHRAKRSTPASAAAGGQASALRAELAQARHELGSTENLVDSGSLAPIEASRARTKVELLNQRLRAAVSGIQSSHSDSVEMVEQFEADLSAIEAQHADLEIKAPFAGVVLQSLAKRGDLVAEAQAAFVFAESSEHIVTLAVDEAAISQVRARTATEAGSPATVTVYALDRRAYPGEVVEVAPEADRERRTFRVRVRLPGPHPELKTGMTAEANIVVRRHESTTLVPTEALDKDGVWTIQDGHAHKRTVSLGIKDLRFTEVLSGIRPGETVVVHAESPLSEGAWVRTR